MKPSATLTLCLLLAGAPSALPEETPAQNAPSAGATTARPVSKSPTSADHSNKSRAVLIKELAEAQRQLAEAEEKYLLLTHALSEASRDGIVFCALDGKVVEANPAYLDMLGYSLEEIRKLTYQELTPPWWHEMENKLREDQVMEKGVCDIYEKEYVRKDGKIFPIRTRAWLVKDDRGRPWRLLGIVRNIAKKQ